MGDLLLEDRRASTAPDEPRKIRVAMVCAPGQDHFLGPLVERLSREPDIEPSKWIVKSGMDLQRAFSRADVVFVEWATDVAVDASRMQIEFGIPLVVRLHSYEAFGPWPRLLWWENVERCVFVAEHVRQIVRDRFPEIVDRFADLRTPIIPNGVDLDRFRPQPWAGLHRIGVVANVSGKKCPEMWLQILALLPERFSLHVAGRMDDPRFAYYLPHMAERLGVADRFHLDGPVADVVEWWRDKDFCLSTSPHEGCPLNVIEAAALGKYVVCHDIMGARDWPCDARFGDVTIAVARFLDGESAGPIEHDERFYARFSLDANAAAFARLFRELAS